MHSFVGAVMNFRTQAALLAPMLKGPLPPVELLFLPAQERPNLFGCD
jgi:hypothetical protein